MEVCLKAFQNYSTEEWQAVFQQLGILGLLSRGVRLPLTGALPTPSFWVPLCLQPSTLVHVIHRLILSFSVLYSFPVFSGHCPINSTQPQFCADTGLRITDSEGVLQLGLHQGCEKRLPAVSMVLTPPGLQASR